MVIMVMMISDDDSDDNDDNDDDDDDDDESGESSKNQVIIDNQVIMSSLLRLSIFQYRCTGEGCSYFHFC